MLRECVRAVALLALGSWVLLAGAGSAAARPVGEPVASAAATCSDFPNQAAAQRAANTRDADGDGIYCESLPCPCAKSVKKKKKSGRGRTRPSERSCTKPRRVQNVTFSATRYPNIRRHMLRALRRGWPRVLTLHRRGASQRREQLLSGIPTRRGYDRDEYPPAVGRSSWRADVAYVPSRENRSHGSVLGLKLRRFCSGTRFRYVFY